MLGSGIIGAWMYRENITLKKKSLLLEAEKAQLEAVSRTVNGIEREEVSIRKLLGLENINSEEEKP